MMPDSPPKGALLWGGIKWVPFLALPFSVLFLEVRWQHEIFANDFDAHRLSAELKGIEERIDQYEGEEARMRTRDVLDARALELRLVEPQPNQIETVGTPDADYTDELYTPWPGNFEGTESADFEVNAADEAESPADEAESLGEDTESPAEEAESLGDIAEGAPQ